MQKIFLVSDGWEKTHKGAGGAFLEAFIPPGAGNPGNLRLFQEQELAAIIDKNSSKSRDDIRSHPTFQAYEKYYKTFRKTYHVLLQFQSLVLERKPFPETPPMVRAMFLAEMKTFLLTAVHDMEATSIPVILDSADGDEEYCAMGGTARKVKTGDMFMRDSRGIISSIIYGPDERTKVTDRTSHALFTVYIPSGVGKKETEEHLDFISEALMSFSPETEIRSRGILRNNL
jgi:DNA/RNA-binding domain of Phe-tRNA-synthetase-like protein